MAELLHFLLALAIGVGVCFAVAGILYLLLTTRKFAVLATVATFLGLLVWAACTAARAGELRFGYDQQTGGRQLSGVPINRSAFSMEYSLPLGSWVAGGQIEATQTGRAGLADDCVGAHGGRVRAVGRLTLTPEALAGYCRGLNRDFGYLGGRVRADYAVGSRVILEAEARYRHSFAENTAPLNASDLSHSSWHEVAVRGGPVLMLSPKMGVGVNVERDFGTDPHNRVGMFLRVAF